MSRIHCKKSFCQESFKVSKATAANHTLNETEAYWLVLPAVAPLCHHCLSLIDHRFQNGYTFTESLPGITEQPGSNPVDSQVQIGAMMVCIVLVLTAWVSTG